MKKYILLLLAITAIGLSSCKKEVLVPADNGLPNKTYLRYIQPGDWKQDGNTLSVFLPVSDLDAATFENDEVALSISRRDNDLYDKLPLVDNARSYSYTYAIGGVTLFLQNAADLSTPPVRPTEKSRVKIVLITSSL
jgi:hypothetical protein